MIDEKGNVGKMNLPRLMIAAPGSGSGKTMLTCGLLKLLQQRCRPVAFKCGPDYIDPMFHRAVLGIPSRNLDTFFTEADTTNYLMGRSAKTVGADFAVIEGVMGYYDGLGGISTKASSYELSVQTETPVVLVVGGKGMSLSILAVIRGFLDLYPDQKIVGVILNRVSEAIF
jgi:cobyrinic acid a,c-diamide synthase